MRNAIRIVAAAVSALSGATGALAARATECTAINICYCVEADFKPAIEANVGKIRKLIAEQKAAGKAIGYMSVPLSTAGGSYFGVNNDVVISFTFGLGSALAGAGGILYALNYPSIDPLMGVMPGLKAFVAAVLGGIGNIPGAALGGLLLGTVETFVNGSQWSTYKDAIAFAILIIILLFRPAGLLGKFTVEKV